jgi:hypothetical protein
MVQAVVLMFNISNMLCWQLGRWQVWGYVPGVAWKHEQASNIAMDKVQWSLTVYFVDPALQERSRFCSSLHEASQHVDFSDVTWQVDIQTTKVRWGLDMALRCKGCTVCRTAHLLPHSTLVQWQGRIAHCQCTSLQPLPAAVCVQKITTAKCNSY